MQTFVFPSGTTVELPEGMTLCQSPDAVTYDCARFIPVGETPAGRTVLSSYSCAAYARAAAVLAQRDEVADRERILRRVTARRRPTARVAGYLAHQRDVLARMLTAYADDPAPCTCHR